jgi:uncharacterized RDD family membrane protein YckC
MAMSVDWFILSSIATVLLVTGLAALNLSWLQGGLAWRGDVLTAASSFVALYLLALLCLNCFYFTYFHGLTGQTPGKMLFRVRVTRLDGETMTMGIAFLRWAAYHLSSILLLGFLWVAVDPRKQGWHDKIAGTVVIADRRESAQMPLPLGPTAG